VNIDLDVLSGDAISTLFCEELGAVIQTPQVNRDAVEAQLRAVGVGTYAHRIGTSNSVDRIAVRANGQYCLDATRTELHRVWSETTWRMQSLRDNPECAQQEYDRLFDSTDPGIRTALSFDAADNIAAPHLQSGIRPRIAVLREQGVNGHVEMAAAFHRAGFTAVDVVMSDIISGAVGLDGFKGLVACGGFSFGDVLGAGQGWAKSILYQPRAAEQFAEFFARTDTFALGVCNGCQMFAGLVGVIDHAEYWPHFRRNLSEQFEARFLNVEIPDNPSVLLRGMAGSTLPVVVAHGEGRVEFGAAQNETAAVAENLVVLRYVDHTGRATEQYPYNPNGSPHGMAGFTTPDGRVTIMMPHPERVCRTVTNSWAPGDWGEHGPWMRMFWNARAWVD
jgi:phosphoribosylformylglycinamidine synthase